MIIVLLISIYFSSSTNRNFLINQLGNANYVEKPKFIEKKYYSDLTVFTLK